MNDQKILMQVDGIVEANTFEHLCLWEKFNKEVTWREARTGLSKTLGKLNGFPIEFSYSIDVINGYNILFWESTSRVVDYDLIKNYLSKHCPRVKIHTNAMNFRNAFPYGINERKDKCIL